MFMYVCDVCRTRIVQMYHFKCFNQIPAVFLNTSKKIWFILKVCVKSPQHVTCSQFITNRCALSFQSSFYRELVVWKHGTRTCMSEIGQQFVISLLVFFKNNLTVCWWWIARKCQKYRLKWQATTSCADVRSTSSRHDDGKLQVVWVFDSESMITLSYFLFCFMFQTLQRCVRH